MPHTRLPSEQELIQSYGVSRITVLNALQRLAQQGILYRVPGRGTFVAEPAQKEEKHPGQQQSIPSQNMSGAAPAFFPSPVPAKKAIAFIIPCVTGLYAVNMIEGISACAAENCSSSECVPASARAASSPMLESCVSSAVRSVSRRAC